jgi:tight adherence protein C
VNALQSLIPYVGPILLSAAAVLIVTGALAYVEQRKLLVRRLTSHGSEAKGDETTAASKISLEDGLLERFERFLTPRDGAERSAMRRRLIRAGYWRPSALRLFYTAKAGLAFGFAVLSALIVPFLPSTTIFPIVGAIVIGPALIGYLAPSFWIERQSQRRKEAAELGFPDTLDMLLVCIESGQSIDQACRRVAREIQATSPVLAEEFKIVNDELWAGKDRATVFHDFADRLGAPDISAFATVLKQSDEFGVSIAETLRVYASEMRNKRIMRAEEKANIMPLKVMLGSVLFTVPPTMLIMAGPSLIMMLRAFATTGQH